MQKVFLTAEWRQLVMLNYAVEPQLLARLVPRGLQLDAFDGVCYVSVVGLLFRNTRVLGVSFPFHRNFEEVNLRFYVRQRTPEGWRRGVVFVKELVPRFAIAFLARTIYGEPYSAVPMSHEIVSNSAVTTIRYRWRRNGSEASLSAGISGAPEFVRPGSVEEFITENYWGYNTHRGRTKQYEVEHLTWKIWQARQVQFEADVRTLYGGGFVEPLAAPPASAFVAEGSPVIIRRGSELES